MPSDLRFQNTLKGLKGLKEGKNYWLTIYKFRNNIATEMSTTPQRGADRMATTFSYEKWLMIGF